MHKKNIIAYSILSIPLRLFDGSSVNSISQAVDLRVRFPTEETQDITFYVTPLDSSCSVVLGHNWLTRYNPLIDWVLGSITFRTPVHSAPPPTTSPPKAASATFASPPFPASVPPVAPMETPRVAFINANAYIRASRLEGSETFRLDITSPAMSARSATTSAPPVDLSSVPEDYHEFADVFNKAKSDRLPPHRPYDLKINLEDGTEPTIGPIYSLSG